MLFRNKVHINLEGTNKHFLKIRIWWGGLILIFISQPLYIVAAVLVKISVLGVLDPFKLLINIIVARLFLNEKVKFWEYVGLSLFIPGSIMTLIFSRPENQRYSRQEINSFLYNKRILFYLLCNFLAMAVLMTLCYYILKANPGGKNLDYAEQIDDDDYLRPQALSSQSEVGKELSSSHILNSQRNKNIKNKPDIVEESSIMKFCKNPRLRFLPLIVYPYFGPFVSSLSMILVRVIYSFLISESSGHSNLRNIDVWIYIVLMPTLGFSSYLIINKALKHYETIYIIPLFKVGTLLHSIASGALFLQEFGDYNSQQLVFFL
mmetsp:Transcript_1894/g.1694  ORF Transcript_1894/g.1694 Transcript_1894/m.1694 type:complete len:320 (+) Transcript_1894:112-1071(+)